MTATDFEVTELDSVAGEEGGHWTLCVCSLMCLKIISRSICAGTSAQSCAYVNCEILGPRKIVLHAAGAAARKRARLAVLTSEEKRALEALQEPHVDDHDFGGNNNFGFGILDGSETVDISHAGGEFHELTQEVLGDFWNQEVYMTWHLANGDDSRGFFACHGSTSPDEEEAETITIKVVDMFYTFIASALVHQGVIPCSPITPTTGITVQAVEFYRIARQRNPHYLIQAYVKTTCDLQGVQFHAYLSCQFLIAYDMLKHTCPACTYTLAGEVPLKFRMLYTKDGNDSLKRVLKQHIGDNNLDSNDTIAFTQRFSELPTMQFVGGDQYLPREYIDCFTGDMAVDMLTCDDEDNPCAGCWKNMKDEKTKRMWGVFDESGIFMAMCRHGFSLVIADMVQSGEQAKYPLVVVSKLLDAFGNDLGDLRPPSVAVCWGLALENLITPHSLLDHLAMYVNGLGLEDLKGCEWTFSKSNALASSVRYASVFHQRQAIANYFQHNDDYEIYANLGTFLYNNYKQALHMISNGEQSLPKLMYELSIEDKSVFDTWLAEERAYLTSLSHKPTRETLQMEYWQKLVNLSGSNLDCGNAKYSAVWSP
ncbi:hypothetical protein DFH29DRAFT_881108 [Suillus ampliporus]|nr:hypothetical protein DFH29DRAFT_881108 [Suillus ampliporus]